MGSLSILVVGGGVFGATAALELALRGHRVQLFDPGPLPHRNASSTDISKAVRMDYGSDALYAELAEAAIAGWERWNERWGIELYHPCGVLFLSRQPFAPGAFENDSYHLLRSRGHALERIDPYTLRTQFPAWVEGRYADGYFNPIGGWAESGKVVAKLLDDARAQSVTIGERAEVVRIHEAGGRAAGVVTRDGKIHGADRVVAAVGAWMPSLLPHLREVLWAVGQPVLHFRPRNPLLFEPPFFSVWCADISNTGWYGFPATADGIVKVGNHGAGRRMDPAGEREVAASEEPRFRNFLRSSLPALADAPLASTRLCLYEESFDGDFWIDRDASLPGLVVAGGGSGHGFKFAPVLGRLIADVLEEKPNPFAARFAARAPAARKTEQARHLEGK